MVYLLWTLLCCMLLGLWIMVKSKEIVKDPGLLGVIIFCVSCFAIWGICFMQLGKWLL